MDIKLYEHNEKAYEKIKEMFEKENKCCIIHPTGTGKSYIALKWILENKDKKSLIVTPNLSIIGQIELTIRENNLSLEKDFKNLKMITYHTLLKDPYIESDNIILDEFHMAGAPKWGQAVETLLNVNKDSKVLGLTATPVRYLNRNRDMSDELFDGNVASHITLPKAIASEILPPPTYVNAIYSFKEDLKKIEEKINKIQDKETKKELEEKLKLAQRATEHEENLPDLFEKYMENKKGKYLVFCRDIEHLNQVKETSKEMFKKVNNNIEAYYVHSEEKQEENKYTLDRFHYLRNDNLKLLYSVGMLNQGVHVKDIDGVVMLRPTSSPILYFQQLGRALTTGVKGKNPLVFDVVNNIECLKDIELLRDTVISTMNKNKQPKEKIEKMKQNFKIIDDYKKISTLIKELDIEATYGWEEKYELLKKYVKEHNGKFPTILEPIIGSWLSNQRTSLKKEQLSEERKAKLDAIGEWNKSQEDKWEENYELLKRYVKEHRKFPAVSEPIIGEWLRNQRKNLKNLKDKNLSKERIAKLDALGDWNASKEEKWNKNYELLKKYIEKNEKFPEREEPTIGTWLRNQRTSLKKEKLSEERKVKLDALGDWSKSREEKYEEKWEENYEQLKKYVKEHGKFPAVSEPIIGSWLRWQYTELKEEKLSEERKVKLDSLGDWSKSREEKWEENYEQLKKYIEKNEKFPEREEPTIGIWLRSQRTSLKKEKLSEERKVKLDALGDWSKSREEKYEEKWEEKYELLKKYVKEHGKFPAVSEPIIGSWLRWQYTELKEEKLLEERKVKLDALGDWQSTRKKVTKVTNLKEKDLTTDEINKKQKK